MKVNIGDYQNDGSEQDIEIHIDKWDTFNVDVTLAYIIIPVLQGYRDNLHGWPNDLADMKDWEEILDKMIWAFTVHLEDEDFDLSKEERNRVQEGFDLFGKYYRNLWD